MFRPMALAVVLLSVAAACGNVHDSEDITAAYGSPAEAEGTEAAAGGSATISDSAAPDASTVSGPSSPGTPSATTVLGGGTQPGAATAAPAAQGSAGPATGAPIRVGHVGTYSGPLGGVINSARDAVLAWAADYNARGGYRGRPIEVVVIDDQGDPALNAAGLRDAVENEGIVAVVGNFAVLSSPGGAAYIEQSKIPIVGGDTTNTAYTTSAYWFLSGPSFEAQVGGIAKAADLLGLHNIGLLYCAESAFCSNGVGAVRDYAQRFPDTQVVYDAQITLTAPDYTAECLAAQDRGVDFIAIGGEPATIKRIATSCARQGYYPVIGPVSIIATPDLAAHPDIGSIMTTQPTVPWFTDSPVLDEYRRVFARYSPQSRLDAASVLGWSSAKLFEAAITTMSAELTPAGIVDALNALDRPNNGGITVPLEFGATPRPGPDCFFLVTASDKEWKTPMGLDPICSS